MGTTPACSRSACATSCCTRSRITSGSATSGSSRWTGTSVTYSIVAFDPEAGEVGCAVQSKYFAIGAVTPWVRADTGAVATQAMGVVAANGQRVLEALAAGVEPAVAIERVLAEDDGRETRQLGAVTAAGRAA